MCKNNAVTFTQDILVQKKSQAFFIMDKYQECEHTKIKTTTAMQNECCNIFLTRKSILIELFIINYIIINYLSKGKSTFLAKKLIKSYNRAKFTPFDD